MGHHTPSSVRKIFHNKRIRSKIFAHLSPEDITSLRMVSSRLNKLTTPTVFKTLTVTFHALTFSPDRLVSLERIGHNVETLKFIFPHTEATYMPPMLDPESRRLVTLIHEPYARHDGGQQGHIFRRKRIDALALHNYGIILMAAVNIHQFTQALSSMKNLKALIVSCPGTPMGDPGRRCIVDYALWSLRSAVERAGLQNLRRVSLDPIHLAGVQYFLPGVLAVGSVISSRRVWRQVRKISLTVSAWKELANGTPAKYKTHLKLLHQFLEYFNHVEELTFSWTREARWICPLTLDLLPSRNPLMASKPASDRFIVNRPLTFPNLNTLRLENVGMNASDLKSFLSRHTSKFKAWFLEDVYFVNGSLEEALEPLTIIAKSGGESKQDDSHSQEDTEVSFIDLVEEVSFHSPDFMIYGELAAVSELRRN